MYKKKIILTRYLLVFILALLIFVLYGKLKVYRDISLSKVNNKLELNNNVMVKGDNNSFRKYYGLDEEDYKDVLYYKPKSNMDVDEVLIVKVQDKNQIDAIEESINERIKTQENTFKDYAPEQYCIIKNSEIDIKGDYVFLAVSKNADKIRERFIQCIE